MVKPFISVICPSFNEEMYVKDSLLSILNQDYKNYEIIAVDNNSKDNTLQNIKKVLGKKGIVIEEKKIGYMSAVHAGVIKAKGEYITFGEADSRYPKEWLSKIEEDLKKWPNTSVLYGTVSSWDANPIYNKLSHWFFRSWQHFSILCGVHNTAGFNLIIRKSDYFKAGGYDAKRYNRFAPDMELTSRIKKFGIIHFDSSLCVKTSARRFLKDGYLRTIWMYIYNWFFIAFHKQPPMDFKTYNKIREK